MKKISAEVRLLFTLFTSVVVFGLFGLQQLLASPGPINADESTYAQGDFDSFDAAPSRQPSSIGPKKDIVIPSFSWNVCDLEKSQEKSYTVSGTFVQLRLSRCGNFSKKKNSEMVIVNKTNGYTASVFNLTNGEMQTDLIQLQSGANEITIQYLQSNGETHLENISLVSNQ